jgi:hypothetical protein
MIAPQVGLEPTTLRLTVGNGIVLGQAVSEAAGQGAAPDCAALHQTAHPSPGNSPSVARCFWFRCGRAFTPGTGVGAFCSRACADAEVVS